MDRNDSEKKSTRFLWMSHHSFWSSTVHDIISVFLFFFYLSLSVFLSVGKCHIRQMRAFGIIFCPFCNAFLVSWDWRAYYFTRGGSIDIPCFSFLSLKDQSLFKWHSGYTEPVICIQFSETYTRYTVCCRSPSPCIRRVSYTASCFVIFYFHNIHKYPHFRRFVSCLSWIFKIQTRSIWVLCFLNLLKILSFNEVFRH